MILLLVPLVAGAIIGRLFGGRLEAIGALRFRAPALVFVCLAAQALLGRAPPTSRGAVVVLSYLAVGAWIFLNTRARRRPLQVAFALIGLGWAMNFAAIAPTGAMPVSEEALAAIRAPSTVNVEDGHLFKHVRRSDQGPTTWLGDEIPVPALKAVISVGDIALALGMLLLVSSAMLASVPDRAPSRQAPATRKRTSSSFRAAAAASSGIQWLTPSSSTNR